MCFNSSRALCKFSARPLKFLSCPATEDVEVVALKNKIPNLTHFGISLKDRQC